MNTKKLSILALMIMVWLTVVIAGCNKNDNTTPNDGDSNTNISQQNPTTPAWEDAKENDTTNTDEDLIDEDILTEENYKMHSRISTPESENDIEIILQKKWENISISYVKFPMQEALPWVKIKKMIRIKDQWSFVQYIMDDKPVWTEVTAPEMAQQNLENGINPKKLLEKFKEENVEKVEKEIEGTNYDCYTQDEESICFQEDTLRFILSPNNTTTEIIEYTDTVDSDAFDLPSKEEIMSQAEMTTLMMKKMKDTLPTETLE